MDPNTCFLKDYVNCRDSGGGSLVGVERLRAASLKRGDNLHEKLSDNPDEKYWCHKNCISSYGSKHHIKSFLRVKQKDFENIGEPPQKRNRRSDQETFIFKEHCIICGKVCLDLDPRHPERWRPVSQCRTADRGNRETFKDTILKRCEERNDEWGDEVYLRIQGALSDLHAADAQYHRDCLQKFKSNATQPQLEDDREDPAFTKVVDTMMADKSRVWNTAELEEEYNSCGGHLLSRRMLVKRLSDLLSPELLILSGAGVCSILVFRKEASKHMKLVSSEEEDVDRAITCLSKIIKHECKQLQPEQSSYDTHLSLCDAFESCSPTLLNLLSQLTPKLDSTLPAVMIGNTVTGAVTHRHTMLQIGLGLVAHDKSIIEVLHDYGVTCTYDEVLRFKSSAAHAATRNIEKLGLSQSSGGLIQVVADNFDATISSPNGMQSTHALATLVTQPHELGNDHNTHKIKRLQKTEVSGNSLPDVPVQMYEGPKKPPMPAKCALRSPLPLRLLASQQLSLNRAHDSDFQF